MQGIDLDVTTFHTTESQGLLKKIYIYQSKDVATLIKQMWSDTFKYWQHKHSLWQGLMSLELN